MDGNGKRRVPPTWSLVSLLSTEYVDLAMFRDDERKVQMDTRSEFDSKIHDINHLVKIDLLFFIDGVNASSSHRWIFCRRCRKKNMSGCDQNIGCAPRAELEQVNGELRRKVVENENLHVQAAKMEKTLQKIYADLRSGESGGIWRVRMQAMIEKALNLPEDGIKP